VSDKRSENPDKEGLDRRDFMFVRAFGRRGGSPCDERRRCGRPDRGAAGSGIDTGHRLTGDVIQGKPVVTSLDVNDLEPGRMPRLGVVTLSEIGPIWTINQQAKSLKSLASTLAIVGKFRSV